MGNDWTDLERRAHDFATALPQGREGDVVVTDNLRSWLGVSRGDCLRAVPMSSQMGKPFWLARRLDGKIVSLPRWAAKVQKKAK